MIDDAKIQELTSQYIVEACNALPELLQIVEAQRERLAGIQGNLDAARADLETLMKDRSNGDRADIELKLTTLKERAERAEKVIAEKLPHGDQPGDVSAWTIAIRQLSKLTAKVEQLTNERDGYLSELQRPLRPLVDELRATVNGLDLRNDAMKKQLARFGSLMESAVGLLSNGSRLGKEIDDELMRSVE